MFPFSDQIRGKFHVFWLDIIRESHAWCLRHTCLINIFVYSVNANQDTSLPLLM